MTKKLPSYTFIDKKIVLTETTYKGYKIYKVHHKGLEYYSILINEKLDGTYWYIREAKQYIDTI